MHPLPRDHSDDYTHGLAAARRQVVSTETGAHFITSPASRSTPAFCTGT